MSKFLDKKEQVFDFKLTNYGNYLLAVGKLKPAYYTFVDDNVVYDSAYFGRTAEPQSKIHQRIKQETPYLESLVLFEEVSNNTVTEDEMNFFDLGITPTEKTPRKDEFRLNSIIGDAFVAESKEKVPSWKLVSLNNDIATSTETDPFNEARIPQINITASYRKEVVDSQEVANQNISANDERILEAVSAPFADNKVVRLQLNGDVLLYLEEMNTDVLNENFELEVFLLQDSESTSEQNLFRKYFQNKKEQIVDGFMVSKNPIDVQPEEYTEDGIESFFSILKDAAIDPKIACKAANEFNKESYLIDIDFNCNQEEQEDLFYDIYGSETEEDVEICQT
tara:strand:+ start:1172 stop:2182 length:1011 start_codon:yes stop_codon:yes gene_type:complete